MTEKETTDPPTIKDLLAEQLKRDARIGFMTYCVVFGKELPPRFIPRVKNLTGRGDITPEMVKVSLKNSRIWTGTGLEDTLRGRAVEKEPGLILDVYQNLLEEYHRQLENTTSPFKKRSKRRAAYNYPGLSGDPLFDDYWPDIVFFYDDDKAFHQYCVTHLRATILGFAMAAKEFEDLKLYEEAVKLSLRFRDKTRQDPVEIADLIRKEPLPMRKPFQV